MGVAAVSSRGDDRHPPTRRSALRVPGVPDAVVVVLAVIHRQGGVDLSQPGHRHVRRCPRAGRPLGSVLNCADRCRPHRRWRGAPALRSDLGGCTGYCAIRRALRPSHRTQRAEAPRHARPSRCCRRRSLRGWGRNLAVPQPIELGRLDGGSYDAGHQAIRDHESSHE